MKIKMKQWLTARRLLAILALVGLVFFTLSNTAHAQGTTPVVGAMGNLSLLSAQVYLAIVVFLAVTALAVSLVFSAFREHPTEQHLKRSRSHILFAAAIIFITGVFGVYLILKL